MEVLFYLVFEFFGEGAAERNDDVFVHLECESGDWFKERKLFLEVVELPEGRDDCANVVGKGTNCWVFNNKVAPRREQSSSYVWTLFSGFSTMLSNIFVL